MEQLAPAEHVEVKVEPFNCGIRMDWTNGTLYGDGVLASVRTMAEISGIFQDQHAAQTLPPEQEVYRVVVYAPVDAGTEGGLFWGITTLFPGKVGDEYFMTKGHFHSIRSRGEYYLTLQGTGALLLMEESSWMTRGEAMTAGCVHFIPAGTAHRVANTGKVPLVFAACWPSDAGHDYETIERNGFSARLVEREGKSWLVAQDGNHAVQRRGTSQS